MLAAHPIVGMTGGEALQKPPLKLPLASCPRSASGPQHGGAFMRHALGVLGVLAAGVLLAVSAAMNWRFGYQLGRSELDGQIYGAASAAADCFKALVPFFFFAAIKNRMWSQATASALVWVVVTGYSLTSALGHAALNRFDTTGHRAVETANYKDLRADLKRAQDQLGWIPQHRPSQTVQSDIESVKTHRSWTGSKGCTEVNGKVHRDFCQQYHSLSAELASAQQAVKLEERISEVSTKLMMSSGGTVMSEADPQAAVLAKLAGLFLPNLKVEDVQTALTIFVAILLEIGSGFGMYVAFSTWRLYDIKVPALPTSAATPTVAAKPTEAEPAAAAPVAGAAQVGANDNKSAAAKSALRHVAPETDVERFYKERITTADRSNVTATTLYEDYCGWCEEHEKEPLALPTFGREFAELGVQKVKIAGRVRYNGIALRSELDQEQHKKPQERITKAA
jgi:hypothetical protein